MTPPKTPLPHLQDRLCFTDGGLETHLIFHKELDPGDPLDLARRCLELRQRFPTLRVFGGCCGTGLEHFRHLARELKRACP